MKLKQIDKVTLFGLNLYNRERIKETKLDFNIEKIYCDDIGLFVIGEYPNLEYNFVTFSEKKQWDSIALKTIQLAILNLIANKNISVYKFEDKKSYIFNLIKTKYCNYYLEVLDENINDDILTMKIIKAIKESKINKSKITDLKYILKALLDDYLVAGNEYNRPQKKFIIENLKLYAKKYKWLRIDKESKLFGIYNNYSIDLERIYIPRIHMQHENLINCFVNLHRENLDYKFFYRTMQETIEEDFENRYPKNDD